MNKVLVFFLGVVLASQSWGAKAEDPFGLDHGEARDKSGFTAWLADPQNAPAHPLIWLRAVARSKEPQRTSYFKYFFRQTGTKAKKTIAVMENLADDLFNYDALVAEPYPSAGQKKEIAEARARIGKSADAFFAIYDREYRLKVYKVAEKFEGARLLIMDLNRLRQTEVTDEWMATLREQENQSHQGYLYGMLEGRDPATAGKITADYRDTIRFLLSLSRPPEELKGAALAKFKARQKKTRDDILKTATLLPF